MRDRVEGLILAGGLGVRLRPLTVTVPKPLLPLGQRPMLDILLRQFAGAGIRSFHIALGYLGKLVRAYTESIVDSSIGTCHFHQEEQPLGTAGPLGWLPADLPHALVCNCDVLTDLDFGGLLATHMASGAAITIVGVPHQMKLPYGTIEAGQDGIVTGWREAWEIHRTVSAGVYVVSGAVLPLIRPGERLDMPQLAERCLQAGLQVRLFRHPGNWFDIGNAAEYELAMAHFLEEPRRYFGEQASLGGDEARVSGEKGPL